MNDAVDEVCLGEDRCGDCIGGTIVLLDIQKNMLEYARNNEEYYVGKLTDFSELVNKDFPIEKAIEVLSLIVVDI